MPQRAGDPSTSITSPGPDENPEADNYSGATHLLFEQRLQAFQKPRLPLLSLNQIHDAPSHPISLQVLQPGVYPPPVVLTPRHHGVIVRPKAVRFLPASIYSGVQALVRTFPVGFCRCF